MTAERGGDAVAMTEQEGTSAGSFLTPKVTSCVRALAFPRIAEVRRRANDVEDALADEYQQPTTITTPDDAPPELPRLLIPAKDARRGIAISQVTIQMNLLFSDESPTDIDTVAAYVNEHHREIFTAFASVKGVAPAFFGVTTTVQIPTRLSSDAELLTLYTRSILKSPEIPRGYYDLNVKRTTITNKTFHNNITLANYRSYTIDAPSNPVDVVLRIPARSVTARGIEVTGDFNDRYAYNERKQYRTSAAVAQEIVRHAMNEVREAVNEVEAMEL